MAAYERDILPQLLQIDLDPRWVLLHSCITSFPCPRAHPITHKFLSSDDGGIMIRFYAALTELNRNFPSS